MEVPVINRVGDLQIVIGRLPTLISRVLFEQVPGIFSFWKWGALILAVYAIVSSLLVRFKMEFVRFRKRQSAVTKALLSYTSDDDDYSSDDDDDASVSGSSVNEEEEDDDEEEVKYSHDGVFGSLFDFRGRGSSRFENDDDTTCRFTWSNFANGKSVVKLWEGIGLDNPSIVLSAGKVKTSDVIFSLIDARQDRQSVTTNWSSSELHNPTLSGIGCDGLMKVYFSDGGGEKVRAVDLRKATEVMDDAAEWSGVTWWDADGGDDVAGLR